MRSLSRMILSVVLFMLLGIACNEPDAEFQVADRSPQSDREAPFDPEENYPGWAYDQPEYVEPHDPLAPHATVNPDDPPHFFTNKKVVMIDQPGGYDEEEIPRVAIWSTNDNGSNWNKCGYFGRGAAYFPFEAQSDGDYGVRFVGPGQESADHMPATPERVYHVDTVPPQVEISIGPEQTWYQAGQQVTINWNADDLHLIENPVRIGLLLDFTASQHDLIELASDLPLSGSYTYDIPEDLVGHEFTFRVEALDRADNLGLAYSYALKAVTASYVQNEMAQATAPVVVAETDTSEADGSETIPDQAVEHFESFVDRKESEYMTDTEVVASKPPATGETQSEVAPDSEEMVTVHTPDISTAQPMVEVTSSDSTTAAIGSAMTAIAEETSRIVQQSAQAIARVAEQAPKMKAKSDGEQVTRVEPEAATEITQVASDDALPTFDSPDQKPTAMAMETLPESGNRLNSNPTVSRIQPLSTGVESVDVTHGNGLMVPMPATVSRDVDSQGTAHPWRILGEEAGNSPKQSVWALPGSRSGLGNQDEEASRFLEDQPRMRAVAKPGAQTPAVAGVPDRAD